MFDFVKIMETVEEVKTSLAAIEEMQGELMEQLADIKEMIGKEKNVSSTVLHPAYTI